MQFCRVTGWLAGLGVASIESSQILWLPSSQSNCPLTAPSHPTTPVLETRTACPGFCTLIFKPVCALDTNVTHGNLCAAKCAGVGENYSEGECAPGNP